MFRILIFVFLLSSCCVCPQKDVYFITVYPDGKTHGLVRMEKGYLDIKDNWYSQEEIEEIYRKQKEKEQIKSF